MANTRMFRDRVVSLEQTQEIGEKHLDLLKEIVLEALPGFEFVEHGLEHERDLFILSVAHAGSGAAKKVSFTRMVLSDTSRLPAIVESRLVPMRALFVDCIRAQAEKGTIAVSIGSLLTEEEKVEAAEIEAEWRKKHEALLAARRAEEERRERERREKKRQEEARRQGQRERERREREKAAPAPGGTPAERQGPGRRRRRRGAGVEGREGRPQQQPPAPAVTRAVPTPPDSTSPRPQGGGGGGGRRRRRRGRGGPRPGGAAAPQL
jgi:hypothetical protein